MVEREISAKHPLNVRGDKGTPVRYVARVPENTSND